MRYLATLLVATGCEPSPPPPPPPLETICHPEPGDLPDVEMTHYGTGQGELDIVYCGIPPQGGAPYAPFSARFRNLDPLDTAIVVDMEAWDVDSGELLGAVTLYQNVICSNVGTNEGWWVGSELHHRFLGFTTEELHGRTITLDIVATTADGTGVSTTLTANLDCIPGSGS